MMQDTKTIQKFALRYNEHPILIEMFFSHCEKKQLSDEEWDEKYYGHLKEKPKPFVKWVGGKRQLAKQFRDMKLYPPDGFCSETATYFEPFAGGGAMFFDLYPKRAVLSDLNGELIVTYNVIKSDLEKLIKKLKEHQKRNNKEYFLKIRAQDTSRLSDVSIAARFIYLNRTCFNGLYRVNRRGQFNVPYGKNKNPLICDEINLKKVHNSLQQTEILCRDYKKVLDKARKGDFIYFDPPYYPVNPTSSFTSYTKEGFFEKEQKELRDVFVKLHKRGCFVMLSNSDTKFINDLYSGLDEKITINKVFAGRAINAKGSGRGKITEVVVINY